MTFDVLFGEKKSKIGFSQFQQFLGQKGGQILFDFNFDARFGISAFFMIFVDPICYDFYTLIFWPPMLISKFKVRCAGSKHLFKK